MFNIVLLEPEIPANTGNIGRTCLVTGSRLHLIEPLGFLLNDKYLKRAGMDYWKDLDVIVYDSWKDFQLKTRKLFQTPGKTRLWMATTKAKRTYDSVSFQDGDYILFGRESAGIPEEILMEKESSCIRIPMACGQRSLNLSNSVAVVLYEALRQNSFLDLELTGQLHDHVW